MTTAGCGYEIHHIVPKSEGGSNSPENLVKLTFREHYIAHMLLAKIYNDRKMWCAFILMNPSAKTHSFRYSSRLYESLKEQADKTPWNKGIPCSDEQRFNISKKLTGRTLPDDTRERMSAAKKNKPSNFTGHHHTDITIERIRRYQSGRPKPESTRHKIAVAQGRPILQFTLDGKLVAEYCSRGEATRKTGVHNISRAIKNSKTAGGFVWKWKDSN